jgi:uncharacterized protein GlcG (DUF336 family)
MKGKWLAVAVVWGSFCAAQAQTLVAERTLSLTAANEAAMAALEHCRKDGHRVAVTVIDQAGRTKVMLRDDGSRPHAVEHSYRKAYTALSYHAPSGEYGKRAAGNPLSAGPLHLPHITTSPGGLPIRAAKEVVGAIGISGSAGGAGAGAGGGGAIDERCAQAGIDRIAQGLAN